MGFEIIDVSGDVGIRVEGRDPEEIFVNAAIGLYNLITEIEAINPVKDITLDLKGDTIEELLISFLNELIFHFDAHGFIGKEIILESNIRDLGGDNPPETGNYWLRGAVRGEEFDPLRHERRLLVKAATYHNLRFIKDPKSGLWKADIIFDI